MTLDELCKVMFNASQKAWSEHGPASIEIERAAVLAVLDEVKRAVPDARPGEHYLYRAGWDECRAAMIQRLDEMAK